MNTWYWAAEFGKVFLGYLFFMFLWPSVVFNRYLNDKSISFRFSFCVTVQPLLAATVVLMLGLFHLLYTQVVMLLFYGAFIAAVLRSAGQEDDGVQISGLWAKCRKLFCESAHDLLLRFRAHAAECSVLGVLLLFGALYFSYGSFQVHSYGFGDLYVHHAWVHGLKEGKIFSGGVYPEAMHCFVYCLNALLGIRVYSVMLFLQGIHVIVFLTAGYLLLREVFHWRYTPLLALTLFLTLNVVSADLVYAMFRLQTTLPLEFGLHTQFLCALYLMRFLKKTYRIRKKWRFFSYCRDDDLLLFTVSLSASVSIHFYSTIMAFALCACFAVFKLKKLFSKENFIPLAESVLCACIVAIFPMAAALLMGTSFNYSINWAVNSMSGGGSAAESSLAAENPLPLVLLDKLTGVYREGYAGLYGTVGAGIIVLLTCAVIVLCLILRRKSMPDWLREICIGYPPLILSTVLFILLYAAPSLGGPGIISDSRICSTEHMLIMALVMIPADIALSALLRLFAETLVRSLSLAAVVWLYGFVVMTGNYHGYLFYELTRYNATVEVTNSIIAQFPPKTYLLVSPTDELYPIVEYGWHEELLTFVQNMDDEAHIAALGEAFIYVEKKPLQYAQAYFFDGPPWLAEVKYKDIYWSKYGEKYPDTGASQAPEINASNVLETDAQAELTDYKNLWLSYTRLPSRSIIEARAYNWCQDYMELNPGKMTIYYEDDDFVCYHLTPVNAD